MYSHFTDIEVRYYETDQMGVVHHSNYIRYFETGREKMMDNAGIPYTQTEARGIIMPVHSVHCDYIYPAHYGETLRLETSLKEVPRSRIIFYYRLFNPQQVLLATGTVELAFVDKTTGRPTRAPKFLTDVIEKLLHL